MSLIARCIAVVAVVLSADRVCVGQQALENSSLRFVPQNASFYSATFRLREQFETVLNSRAVGQLMKSPIVQALMDQGRMMWEQQSGELLSDPENQQLFDVLLDAVSSEVFIYGDAGVSSLADVVADVFEDAIRIGADADDQAMNRLMLDAAHRNLDKLGMPQVVIGFRLGKREPAMAQLKRLEPFLMEQDALKFGRRTLGDSEFWVLEVESSELMPERPEGIAELGADAPKKYDEIMDRLMANGLTIALGITDDYLVVSIGSDTKALEQHDQTPSLAKHPNLQELRQHFDKKLVSIQYASKELVRAGRQISQQSSFWNLMLEGMRQDETLPAEVKTKLATAFEGLLESPQDSTKAGPVLNFAWMSPAGYDGMAIEWGKATRNDFSKPLPLVKQVSSPPLFFHASRVKDTKATYSRVRDFLSGMRGLFEKTGSSPEELTEEQKKFAEFLQDVDPLVARLDKVVREKLLDGLKDGSWAISFDLDQMDIPEAPGMPLPIRNLLIPYPTFFLGVSDRKSLTAAAPELLEIARDMGKKMESMQERIEDPQSPEVPAMSFDFDNRRVKEAGDGRLFEFPVKTADGKEVASHVIGVSESLLIYGAKADVVADRLRSSESRLDLFGLEDKPIGSVTHFDFTQVVTLIESTAQSVIMAMEEQNPTSAAQIDGMFQQGEFVFDLLRCFGGTTSVSYKDGDAIVTRYQTRFSDIKR